MKKFALITLATLGLGMSALAEEAATYKVTIKTEFKKDNFKNRHFPKNPHFSPVVITSHSPNFDLFKMGSMATTGVKNVAETGNPTVLNGEIDQSQMLGFNLERTQTRGLMGVDEVSAEITLTKDYPLVSLISMIAPSPDWVIGVSGLSLLKGEKFIDKLELPLYAIDAGTDSGMYYESDNSQTMPQGMISLLKNVSGLSIDHAFGKVVLEKL